MTSENPLSTPSRLPYRLPEFAAITDAHLEAAIMAGMAEQRAEIDAIAADEAAPTFENTLAALEHTGARLRRAEAVFELLNSADTNPAREAINERTAPLLAAHRDATLLDPRLYERVAAVHARRADLGLDAQESWLLERWHTDFLRAGAALSESEQQRVRDINSRLASLIAEFDAKERAENKALTIEITDVAELDGLAPDAIATAAEAAAGRASGAPYAINLLRPTDQPALAALTDRAVRERIHRTAVSRGTRGTDNDTTELVRAIVALRAEKATIFGYPHFAAYQIADNTARTSDAVADLLARLAPAAVANAAVEAADLQAVIDADGGGFELRPWDWSFYSERVRKARYDIDENAIRPYLELDRVLRDGVFFAATRLYGITFTERTDLHGYAPDVRVFEVFEADGSPLGLFLADLYTRPTKSSGAWMESLETANDVDGTGPVVVNNSNITKPPAGTPTLLTLDEVRTLFHEFGHALHGLFGRARWPRFGGTHSPRDFVEFPSQVNEMWMLWPEVLTNYARHIDTGEPLPQAVVDRLTASSAFNQGFETTAYLAATLLDLAWHTIPAGGTVPDVVEFEAEALEKAGVAVDVVPPRYRSAYFAHIFATDSYSAGYYSYIWAEVLDADTVDWITATGGLTRANGDRYRHGLLERCGSADALEVFRAYRGQDASIEPLLRRRGLVRA